MQDIADVSQIRIQPPFEKFSPNALLQFTEILV